MAETAVADRLGTRYPAIFSALAAPFGRDEIKSRTAHGGRVLHYITARTAMNRLDEVLGPECWEDDYEFFGQAGCKCYLTLRMPDGSTVRKCGVGGVTPMPDESDTEKTGEADAFKRACVKAGIGRYLYQDGTPRYMSGGDPGEVVDDRPRDSRPAPHDEPPRREQAPSRREQSPARDERPVPNGNGGDRRPRSGKALFGWIRDEERHRNQRLLPTIQDWGKNNGFPERMLDWDADQVLAAWEHAVKLLA
jgi:hypothetical protein